MPYRSYRLGPPVRWALLSFVAAVLAAGAATAEPRRTPIVAAVDRAKAAIVNIHGEKTVTDEARRDQPENLRRVNGMGTGVIIDERGYIVTNHHVVEGVPKIQVTLSDDTTYIARLLSFDAATDLAIIHIDAGRELPVIPIGTSQDLLLGETVIAVGNAYGYSHTVTHGIISSLHRSVQVSDMQGYDDLIQTDAAINPGNSGGPLLNIDGEMIGVNVAVRAGAQLIGFAIPVDNVMTIVADLLSTRRLTKTWHGVATRPHDGGLIVAEVDEASPAASIGLQAGDVIKSVRDRSVTRTVDLERALLECKVGEEVPLAVEREQKPLALKLVLAKLPDKKRTEDASWDQLGLRVQSTPARQFAQLGTKYTGGLTVSAVRPDSPAARQGIRRGDILVGMHRWETTSTDHVAWVLSKIEAGEVRPPVKFYIVRGSETFSGQLIVAQRRLP